MKSYKDLDIYILSVKYAIEVHEMSMKLPKYELYEQGSQIRRSSKSIKDNIVEGYGRGRYKQDFVRFLTYAHASSLECMSQLELINILHDIPETLSLIKKYDSLRAKIYSFIKYVQTSWKS